MMTEKLMDTPILCPECPATYTFRDLCKCPAYVVFDVESFTKHMCFGLARCPNCGYERLLRVEVRLAR